MYGIGSQTKNEIFIQATCTRKKITIDFQRKRMDDYNQYKIFMNDY